MVNFPAAVEQATCHNDIYRYFRVVWVSHRELPLYNACLTTILAHVSLHGIQLVWFVVLVLKQQLFGVQKCGDLSPQW